MAIGGHLSCSCHHWPGSTTPPTATERSYRVEGLIRSCGCFGAGLVEHVIGNSMGWLGTSTIMSARFLKQCRLYVTNRWSSGRAVHTQVWSSKYNHSLRGDDMPRAGGIATMLRLPYLDNKPQGLNVCFVGIPFDSATSHRSGTRHGPRAIRHESSLIEPCNIKGAVPYESLQVADIGDVPVNTFNISKTADIITEYYGNILKADCVPLTLGGDHFITYPILRAVKEKYGPVGLIHVDAHTDLGQTMFGETLAHGTPFYRALEDGAVDPNYMFQIGIRASCLVEEFHDAFKWAKQKVGVVALFSP